MASSCSLRSCPSTTSISSGKIDPSTVYSTTQGAVTVVETSSLSWTTTSLPGQASEYQQVKRPTTTTSTPGSPHQRPASTLSTTESSQTLGISPPRPLRFSTVTTSTQGGQQRPTTIMPTTKSIQTEVISPLRPSTTETVMESGGCTPFVAGFGVVTAIAIVQMVVLIVLVAMLVRSRRNSRRKFSPTQPTERDQPVLKSVANPRAEEQYDCVLPNSLYDPKPYHVHYPTFPSLPSREFDDSGRQKQKRSSLPYPYQQARLSEQVTDLRTIRAHQLTGFSREEQRRETAESQATSSILPSPYSDPLVSERSTIPREHLYDVLKQDEPTPQQPLSANANNVVILPNEDAQQAEARSTVLSTEEPRELSASDIQPSNHTYFTLDRGAPPLAAEDSSSSDNSSREIEVASPQEAMNYNSMTRLIKPEPERDD